jgi:hypothetical protein
VEFIRLVGQFTFDRLRSSVIGNISDPTVVITCNTPTQYISARESGRVNDGEKEMNFQMARFTGHKKFLITLGVGAIALTAVACGSAVSVDEAPAGDPPPVQVGGDNSEFALGAPNGVDNSGGIQLASGELVKDSSIDGSVTAGAPIVAPGTPLAPAYNCDATGSDPFTLYIQGEPIGHPVRVRHPDSGVCAAERRDPGQ